MAKSKRKPDDPVQSKRFIDKAKEVADEDAEGAFERAIANVTRPKEPARKTK